MQSARRSCNIVLAGEAGQGIQLIEAILVDVVKRSGYHVFATKEYMSRVRGGSNSTSIRVSDVPVTAYSERMDILVALDEKSIARLEDRIGDSTLVVAEGEAAGRPGRVDVPLTRLATEAGDALYANSVAAGIVCGMLGIDEAVLAGAIGRRFAAKGGQVEEGNRKAALSGRSIGVGLRDKVAASLPELPAGKRPDDLLLSGAEAVALGALAGGCNFVCSYPMTPGSSVLSLMAEYSRSTDVLVEQAEDEIAAINMALGAWFSGARALVTTSGGGFALMSEGMSLAGASELPFVVHLAQRPGPATGMPTRTEQGDLELALYAGHGFFPRAILAPANLEEGFRLARHAMDLADRCQIPVILLTDQYFVDSYHDLPEFSVAEGGQIPGPTAELRPEEAADAAGYRRYALTPDGLSPRAIPGRGKALAVADSHEHDEEGLMTEDPSVRAAMVAKRLRKLETVRALSIPPTLKGPSDYDALVVSWGSTGPIVAEALEVLGRAGAASLHFSQIFPLHSGAAEYLRRAKNLILVENNETGQFGDLLAKDTGIVIGKRVLKSDGMPFSVEELVRRLAGLM
jgi:2-oxoglutarate ferredoxin oxidoreductase subunit alpha